MNYYLVYLSSATSLYTEQELSQILKQSHKNNAEKDITGILLYHEGNIIQVLEGEENSVKSVYKKILHDHRHKDILKLIDGFEEERSFPDWSMGFKAVNKSDWQEYEGYIDLQPSQLLSLLKEKNNRIDASVKSFIKAGLSR